MLATHPPHPKQIYGRAARSFKPSKRLATGIFIASFFLAFTWRGLFLYFSGDDVANLYRYWSQPVTALVRANVLFWSPYYRPFGGIVYLTLFGIFGLHPLPLYLLYYAVLLLNLYLAYKVMEALSGSAEVAALGTLLFSVHGAFGYLYFNAGCLYDAFCFFFFFFALLLYLRVRQRGQYPGWQDLTTFLVLFICCLNSKETGATLPAIILLYELIFHPPALVGWFTFRNWLRNEGRIGLSGAALLLAYIPGKLAPSGLVANDSYVPGFTSSRFLENLERYTGYLIYSNGPLTSIALIGLFGLLTLGAFSARSRQMWFGVLFFLITLLPVVFVPGRLGYVLYLPMVGLALYCGVLLVWFRTNLVSHLRFLRSTRDQYSKSGLFFLTAILLALIHGTRFPAPPGNKESPIRITIEQMSGKLKDVHAGTNILFVKDLLPENYDLLILMRLLYRQNELFITQLDGPVDLRVPVDHLGRYDHIFTYEDGYYVELDNTDTQRSVRLNLIKPGQPVQPIGEIVSIGMTGRTQYIVKDVLYGALGATECWTGQAPELRFMLSARKQYNYVLHFYLAGQTLEKTGPVAIRYFINGRLLSREVYDRPEEQTYCHPVPADWITSNDFTFAKMEVENPYFVPRDGAKLGFLIKSAGFTPQSCATT